MKAVAGLDAASARMPRVLCVRPETIRISPAGTVAAEDDCNTLDGRVTDAVYTAGTFRYQVDIGAGAPVAVRLPSIRQVPMFVHNQSVTLTWPASATLLIPKD